MVVDAAPNGEQVGGKAPGHDPHIASFEARFAELYALAKRPAWRLLRNQQDAEDAAAEAMARLYLHWRRLGTTPVEAWVLRVTTNVAIDKVRRDRRRPLAPVSDVLGPDGADGPDRRLAVADALRRLPDRQRQVVVLHYFAAMTEAEIADSLGLGLGTIKTHLGRGRRTLAERGGLDELL